MQYIFYFAASMAPDISSWNVSGVTDLKRAFMHASAFDSDLSKWDVSKVTDM